MSERIDVLAASLPCPFCGDQATTFHDGQFWRALCVGSCGAEIETDEDTQASVIAAWNRRTLPAPGALALSEGEVADALDRMDSLLDPSIGLLTVAADSATVRACRVDMATIRAACRLQSPPSVSGEQ